MECVITAESAKIIDSILTYHTLPSIAISICDVVIIESKLENTTLLTSIKLLPEFFSELRIISPITIVLPRFKFYRCGMKFLEMRVNGNFTELVWYFDGYRVVKELCCLNDGISRGASFEPTRSFKLNRNMLYDIVKTIHSEEIMYDIGEKLCVYGLTKSSDLVVSLSILLDGPPLKFSVLRRPLIASLSSPSDYVVHEVDVEGRRMSMCFEMEGIFVACVVPIYIESSA